MDVKTYCDNMQSEVTEWKAKMCDVVRALDKIPSDEKQNFSPQIGDLHTIIDELADRLERLARECPADYSAEKRAIEGKMADLKSKWDKTWNVIYPAAYGS
jgi:predicted nuclease with TOPRIM domain